MPGLAAKPIVDMMPGLRSLDEAPPLIPLLEAAGYEYVPEFERPNQFDEGMPFRRYFRKDEGEARAFHVHMVEAGGEFWVRHLMFRDYLRAHPEDAAAYARLKHELAERYNAALSPASNVDQGYTSLKSGFIDGVLARARTEGYGPA